MKKSISILDKYLSVTRSKNRNSYLRKAADFYNYEMQYRKSFQEAFCSEKMHVDTTNIDLSFSFIGRRTKFRNKNSELMDIIYPVQCTSKIN
ncbi:MAG: hypothetical protein V1720_14900 [bacterium]